MVNTPHWRRLAVRVRQRPPIILIFMEKVESKEKMRNMKRGATIELPISSLETIRNNVSLLNAKHLLEGKKWASKSYPKKGIVVVKRES